MKENTKRALALDSLRLDIERFTWEFNFDLAEIDCYHKFERRQRRIERRHTRRQAA